MIDQPTRAQAETPGGINVAIMGSRGYPSTYGGFETFVRRLAPWLASRGHIVTVYGHGGRRHEMSTLDGVLVIKTRGVASKNLSTISHGMTAAFSVMARRPDVVLALNVANGPALPLLNARGIPSVMNVDGIEWERAKWGPIAKAAFRIGARATAAHATRLVADSVEVARVWRERYRVAPTFIPYGADVVGPLPRNRLDELGICPGSYALVVARLAPENNVDLFLDSLEELGWSIPAVVVGSANYSNPVELRLRQLSDEGRIIWLGHVSDQGLLAQLWSHAGVYFHGHSVGGTNPALLQALGHGAPTLAIDTPYNREVLQNSDQVLLPRADHIAERLLRVIGDASARAALSEYGRSVVRARYMWSDVLDAYETLLLDAAGSERPRVGFASGRRAPARGAAVRPRVRR